MFYVCQDMRLGKRKDKADDKKSKKKLDFLK